MAHSQTQRAANELDSPQKSSRLVSACAHNERSPKMGDITNIARQQSANEMP